MYKIIFSSTAKKQYLKLEKSVQLRISNALRRIMFNPETHVKKLVSFEGCRLRVGKYRIILELKKSELLILVIKIGKRDTIYKRL